MPDWYNVPRLTNSSIHKNALAAVKLITCCSSNQPQLFRFHPSHTGGIKSKLPSLSMLHPVFDFETASVSASRGLSSSCHTG